MKSIRLSLLVYFLVLITGALGAISCLVYHMNSTTLEERKLAARNLIEEQCQNRCDEVKAALDKRIVRQAHTMASMARTVALRYELLYPLGMLGAAPQPGGLRTIPLWLAEWTWEPLRENMKEMPRIEIDAADDLVPPETAGQPQEYFQIYHAKGAPLMRSESLGEQTLSLEKDLVISAGPLEEYFDTVEIEPGLKLRRVTLKTSVTRFRSSSFPLPSWFTAPRFGPGPRPVPNFKGRFTPRPSSFQGESPVIFVQYASDVGPMESRLHELEAERDAQFGQLDAEVQQNLQSLQRRLFGIVLITFAAVAAGGYVLLRLGLAPLHRLSDAVSKVTPQDFQLKVDTAKLPNELKPIAERLMQTFVQLQKAFDREKQAAADISHELRTPLAALMTTVEVGLKKSRTPDQYREILEECLSSGGQMSHLVERLLSLARLDAGAEVCRARGVDVADVALQCADLVRPLAKARGLKLHAHVEPELILQSDPDKIREVLTNLLHNAIEYNRPGGSIDLTVERSHGSLVLEVRDTGIGIAPDALPRIFERFYRADPSRHADAPHAGLGLAIVKSYVDLLGGTVTVESGSEGTNFRITLPAPEPASSDPILAAT